MLEPSEKLWNTIEVIDRIFNEDHSTCIIHALKSEMVTQFYAAFENREDLFIVLGIREK